jgi:sensor histidine kinase YesM
LDALIFAGFLFACIGILLIFFLWRGIEKQRKKRLKHALMAFQSHTNPHFIKNVLQAINWFILNKEKEQASDYLCDFARLMEDILLFSQKKIVSLEDKLRFLDLYLKLQHLRHSNKFDYIPLDDPDTEKRTIQVEEGINPAVFFLPPLLIHPFIENAIEHGLKPKSSKGSLSVTFTYRNDRLICQIADNGIGMKNSRERQHREHTSRSNIGIVNAKKRIGIIKKLYKINIITTIQELHPGEEDPGTLVRLEFLMPMVFNPETGMPTGSLHLRPA